MMTTPVTKQVTVVQHPFQVVHEGRVYRPGDFAEVPASVAEVWRSHGWVEVSGADQTRKRRSPRRQ